MEKVIQMYLRNEYQTIAELQRAGRSDCRKNITSWCWPTFPANFTDTAAKRLAEHRFPAGARCGVYTLIHWDRRLPLPQDFLPDELRKGSVCVDFKSAHFGH